MLKLQNADEIKKLKELSHGLEDSTSHRCCLPKLISVLAQHLYPNKKFLDKDKMI